MTHVLQTTQTESLPIHSQRETDRGSLLRLVQTHTQIGDSCPTNNTDRKSSYTQSEGDRQRQPLTSCTNTHTDRRLMSYKQHRQKVFLYTVRGRQTDRQRQPLTSCTDTHTDRRLMSYKQHRQKVFLYTVRERQTEAASYVLYRHTHR